MNYLLHEKTGLFYREDTLDLFVINEQKKEYSEIFSRCKDKIVLDIGSNIGAFSYNCVKNGCAKVIGFEPEPDNYELNKSQTFHKENRSQIINAAIGPENGKIDLYINKRKNKGQHSILETRGRDKIEVSMISFQETIDKYKPDILKMDTEGAELFLDWNAVNVSLLAIEIHRTHHNEDKADSLMSLIKQKYKQLYYQEDVSFGNIVAYIFVGEYK